jgi:hypothetical protein
VFPETEAHASSFIGNFFRILEVMRDSRLDWMSLTRLSTAMR